MTQVPVGYSHNIYHNNKYFSVNQGQTANRLHFLTILYSERRSTRNYIPHFFKSIWSKHTIFLLVNTFCGNDVLTVYYKSENPNHPVVFQLRPSC